MPFDATCPKCKTEFRLLDKDSGKRFICESCGHEFFPRGGEEEARPATSSYWNEKRSGGEVSNKSFRDRFGTVPRKRKKPDDNANGLLIAAGVGGFLLIAAVGLIVWVSMSSSSEQPQPGNPGMPGPPPVQGGGPGNQPQQVKDLDSNTLIARVENPGVPFWEKNDAIAELANRKEQKAVAPIARLINSGERQQAREALRKFGPSTAAEVLPYFNHGDGGTRDVARSLLREWSINVNTLVARCLQDAESTTFDQQLNALAWFAEQPPTSDRRADVAKVQERFLSSQDGRLRDTAMKGLLLWGTKENTPAVVKVLDRNGQGFLNDAQRSAMTALGKWQDPRGVGALLVYLPNAFAGGEAAKALDQIGPAAAKEAIQFMNHPNGNVQNKVREMLSKGKVSPTLLVARCIQDAGSTTLDQQLNALAWLAEQDPLPAQASEVAKAQERCLGSKDGRVQENALKGLLRWGSKENTPAVVGLLEAKSKEVFPTNAHRWAFEALGKWKDPRGAAGLVLYLPNNFMNGDANKALEQLGAGVDREVVKHMNHPNGQIQAVVRKMLNDHKTPDAILHEQCLEDLKVKDVAQRRAALEWLAQSNPVEAKLAETAKALVPFLTDRDRGTQDAALKALKIHAHRDAVPALIALLEGPGRNAAQHNQIMEILGELKDERAIAVIARRLTAAPERATASKVLKAMGAGVEDEVWQYLTHKDGNVKVEACNILATVGTKKSIEPLRKLAAGNMRDNAVKAAKAALEAIEKRAN